LVDIAYKWNEDWMSEEKNWKTAIVICSGIIYCLSLACLILFFLWFGGAGCSLNKFLISFTLVFTIIFTIISITEWCEHGALLPSAVVTLYCYFLLFGAFSVDPSSCNTFNSSGLFQLIVGLIFSAFSICYAAWNLATSDSVFGNAGQPEGHQPLTDVEKGDVTSPKASEVPKSNSNLVSAPTSATSGEGATSPKTNQDDIDDKDMEEDAQTLQMNSKSTAIFHLVMTAAAMYMAMLLTNWGSLQQVENPGSSTSYDLSVESMWVKIVTEWLTGLLYIWSLIAPYVLSNRDFN